MFNSKAFSKTIAGAILLFFAWAQPLLAEGTQPAAFNLGGIEFLANEPNYIDLGAGAFNFNHNNPSAAGYVEYRYGKKLFFIGPLIGIMANTDGGIFGYGGVYANIKYRKLVLTPIITLGGYRQGGSKSLGGIFQFRTGMTFSYQFDQGSRLGVRFAHVSNAGIYKHNPGENEVLLTYAMPLPF